MSESMVMSIVTGLVTITTIVIGFLTMWVKLKYGADKAEEAVTKAKEVEDKIDNNTAISTLAKNAAEKAEKQTNGVMSRYESQVQEHQTRIASLERQMASLQTSVETVTRNIDSTRHEMRGHLQTIGNKLDIMAINKQQLPPPTTGS